MCHLGRAVKKKKAQGLRAAQARLVLGSSSKRAKSEPEQKPASFTEQSSNFYRA